MDLSLPYDTFNHKAAAGASVHRLINGYAQRQPRSSRSKALVRGSPGISSWVAVGTGPIRGGIEMNELLYVVSGQELWRVDEDGTTTPLGSGIAGDDVIGIAQNGFEIVIVNGRNIFSYLLADNTFIQVAAAGAFAADTVTFLNSVFVFEKKGTNQFFVSGVMDGRTYDILKYASAEANPDFLSGTRQIGGLLYVFGKKSIELWDHTGAAAFPFSAIKGAVVNRGAAASKAQCEQDTMLFFLGDDRVFYQMRGQSHIRVSQEGIESIWKEYGTVDDAYCFSWNWEGSKFVSITFPSENATFTYDLKERLWHERSSYDGTPNVNKWGVASVIPVYNTLACCDVTSNKVGKMEPGVYTEFGNTLLLTAITPPLYDNNRQIGIPALELTCKTGFGGSVIFSYAKDGGYNFAPEQTVSLGEIGDFKKRVRVTRLGTARQWVFKFQISDAVERELSGLIFPED